MFSRIYAIALKEILQLKRDRLTLGMIVGMPMMQILLFGYAINYDVRGLHAGVVDEAQTSFSRSLIAAVQATGVLTVTVETRSLAQLQQRIASGELKAGIYLPVDLERRRLDLQRPLAQLLVDGSEPTVEGVLGVLASMPLPQRAGMQPTQARSFEIRIAYNPERRTAVQVVPGLIGVILSMTMTMFTAVAIVRERERGNLELLITTPASPAELMTGKLLPYIGVGLIQTTLILLAGVFLFRVPINGSLAQLYLAAGLFIASTLTFGLLISTLARTQMQAFQMSLLLLLPSILLSGFVFPFEGMPRFAQWIAQLLPLTHFIVLVRGVVLRGADLGQMPAQSVKLVLFQAVALIVTTLRFRKRLD